MNYLLQIFKAFIDGFFRVFGILLFAGICWFIYQRGFDELNRLPVVQEITDTYQIGWEKTTQMGSQFAERIITLEQHIAQNGFPQQNNVNTSAEVEVSIYWSAAEVAEKLAKEGWSSGKIKAASAYLRYIEKYMDEAIYDMYNSGVSASITIAQGILESDAGRSNLARVTNNHFGIKALPNRNGRKKIRAKMFSQLRDNDFSYKPPAVGVSQHHDDHKYDRFETYVSVQDSYRRHSMLLQNSCNAPRKGCYDWIWSAFPVQKERIDITEMANNFQHLSHFAPTDFFGDTYLPYYAAQAAGLKMAGYATSKKYHKKLVYLIETYELYKLDSSLIRALS